MKKPTIFLKVPFLITCTLVWAWFATQVIEDSNKNDMKESSDIIKRMENIKKNSIAYQIDLSFSDIQKEYGRLKEEERKRLEKLEQERQAKLEQERLARIEKERKLTEARKAELARVAQVEERKKQSEAREKQIISRGSNESVNNNWMTFNASYYTAYCAEGCTGVTATGYNVSNTIYYNGLRIIATDPRVIKLGTIVEVKTPYETFRAISLDTGGAIKNHKIDVLVSSEQEANKLGRHNVQLRILKEPK